MSEPLANTTDELSEQLARMGSLEEQGVSSLPAETDRNEVDDGQIEESKSENESSRNDAIPGVEKALLHRNDDGGNDGNIANDSLHHSSIAGGEAGEIPEPSESEIEPLPGPAGDGDVVPVQPESEGESGGVDDVDLEVDEPVKSQVPQPDVHPVPHPKLRLVNPVPRTKKAAVRASGSTSKKQTDVHPVPHKGKSKDSNRLHPPTIPGHKWKPSGLSGWELYTRKASISASGKRSSTGEYVAYYSQKAVELMNEREKTTNARTA